ncbi:pyrophosphohydrolase [bacterium]|jgi:NTP pyrophosphatase (non-canonical NTP hydrolase)|nr:pyrophosphohydrolase [bacterium]
MATLKKKPTLIDFQKYIHEIEVERNFIKQTVMDKCLMLGEEVGELFKAVRKEQKLNIDVKSKMRTVDEECADVLIFLLSIANRYDIDLEKAFRDKEEINKNRKWS